MNREIKGIHITNRDIEFLRYLHAVKISTYEQIHRDHYSDYTFDGTVTRIKRMGRSGLIDWGKARILFNGKRIMSLTKMAFDILLKSDNEKRIELKSDAIQHDLHLVDIRHRLMKSRAIKEYFTENEFETWGESKYSRDCMALAKFSPDAILDIQLPKCRYYAPLEYDLHSKSDARYREILHKYYRSYNVNIVFFVAESKPIIKKLKKLESKIYQVDYPKFFYALKQNLLESDTIKFINYSKDILELK